MANRYAFYAQENYINAQDPYINDQDNCIFDQDDYSYDEDFLPLSSDLFREIRPTAFGNLILCQALAVYTRVVLF